MSTTTKPRLIDSLPSIERTEPMGVIVMSPARSGTTSVEKALTHLGFRVYEGMKHGFLVSKYDDYAHCQCQANRVSWTLTDDLYPCPTHAHSSTTTC